MVGSNPNRPTMFRQAGNIRTVRDAGGGGQLPTPIFGRSVNLIPTSGADYAHHIATAPPPLVFWTVRRVWQHTNNDEV